MADIVDTAIAAGSFTTLAAAPQAAGLVDTLQGPRPFTVSAPPTAPSRTCPRLPSRGSSGRAHARLDPDPSRQPGPGDERRHLGQGHDHVGLSDGVMINDATVTQAHIVVIHVIDSVLMPPDA